MCNTGNLYMLKLVLMLKTNKSLKLPLADMKANSSILRARLHETRSELKPV